MKKFRLNSELSEKQIEADVATYFGWITPDIDAMPFRLLDVDEQLTGADKKFDWIIPIYMQFKVAEGLAPISKFNFLPSRLKEIQRFRKNNNLFHNPTLYFKLRDLANTASEYQHNILYKLAHKPNTFAFYVAPLTLHKSEYDNLLFDSSNRYLLHPYYYYREQKIRNSTYVSLIKGVPFLRAHISIFPHEEIKHSGHYYSFSPNGTEIAWHSPKYFPDEVTRLSDTLSKILAISSNPDSWISIEEYAIVLSNYSNDFNLPLINTDNKSPLQKIKEFGKNLYLKYEIKQILLATTSKEYSNYMRF
jgi:hypothetical protein